MADVTIEAAVAALFNKMVIRGGPFWTTPLIGYVIYLNADRDLVYRKTTDGGANWGAATQVVAPASCNAYMYDCYADWQTEGDAGTKIHIVYVSLDTNGVRYVYLDTSSDTVAGDDLIETCQGTGTLKDLKSISFYLASITKMRGGNLAIALKYRDSDSVAFDGFYTSPDGDTWTSKTSPLEAKEDYCILFAANLADNQDIWAAYWDIDADEISLKTFDNSSNDWTTIGEASISGSMIESGTYLQMDGQIRLSDGHLIFLAWSQIDNAASDLKVWDINGSGSITAKANVITDEAENVLVSVFINHINDAIYIAYVQGTAWASLVKCVYQKSTDGGANWNGETAMQADAEDDMKWISAGAMKAAWGGKFQPVWFNDDDDDLFTNSDNGITLEVVVAKRGWWSK